MSIDVSKNAIDLSIWGEQNPNAPIPAAKAYVVRLWGDEGFDEKCVLEDPLPTGRQVLEAFGFHPTDEYELLMLGKETLLKSIPLSETINLRQEGPERFFAFKTDRLFSVSIDGQRFKWGCEKIEAGMVRLISRTPESHELYLERENKPDQNLSDDDFIDLSEKGLERIRSKAKVWKLNVQGEILTLSVPCILVKDALEQAGLDPNQGWNIILKVKGEPKKPLQLTDTVDLTAPGIEKLRVSPKDINNGDMAPQIKREFALLPEDQVFLDAQGFRWETVISDNQQWLIIRNYPVPEGLSHTSVDVAVMVPPAYPQAQLDMFYCHPHLKKSNGLDAEATQARQKIAGVMYQRWSRHRKWNPATDRIMTQIAVVEESLARETANG